MRLTPLEEEVEMVKLPKGIARDGALVILSSLMTCILLGLFGIAPAGSGPGALRAERVEIIDAGGEVRAVLGFDDEGGSLELRSATGEKARWFTYATNGSRIAEISRAPEASPASEPASAAPDVEIRACDSATPEEIDLAKRLVSLGWEYVMPRPKSPQARWGNSDGRTTWWNGYWIHRSSGRTSGSVPRGEDGFKGDGQGGRGWRRGGSPGRPSRMEWMCSKSGGVTPG